MITRLNDLRLADNVTIAFHKTCSAAAEHQEATAN